MKLDPLKLAMWFFAALAAWLERDLIAEAIRTRSDPTK